MVGEFKDWAVRPGFREARGCDSFLQISKTSQKDLNMPLPKSVTPEEIDEAAGYVIRSSIYESPIFFPDDLMDNDDWVRTIREWSCPLSDFSRDELMYLLMAYHRRYQQELKASMMKLQRYGVVEHIHEILGALRVVTDEAGLKQLVDDLHEANKKVSEYKPSETEEAA